MRLGFVGLGKMGSQMVAKLLADGHEVVVLDVNQAAVTAMVKAGAQPAKDRADLVRQLPAKPLVWLMIPAQLLDPEVTAFAALLPAGAILIDGGNSDYRLTLTRAAQLADHQIHYIDVGTSGGILGLQHGFSMMVGGQAAAVDELAPALDTLAKPTGAWHRFGDSGTGHYVKMVHNGIEYGLMQAYAEGYQLLAEGPLGPIDAAAVAHVWQQGSIVASNLNGLIGEIYEHNPSLGGIEGYVAESGEGAWTEQTASAAGVEVPALKVALSVREASQHGHTTYATQLLAAMRHAFGGHAINQDKQS